MAAPARAHGFESRWTPVDGVRMHHRQSTVTPLGGTVPVVFVHGLAVSHRYMVPTGRRLARFHPVYLPDLAGFGLSAEPGWNLTVAEHAEQLLAWLDALALDRVAVLGNSFGCQVAVDLASRFPARVRALVLTGPTADPAARSATRQVWRWLRNLPREDPRLATILARDVRDAGLARVAATFRSSLRDRIEDKLPRVTAPTLIVRGALDPVAPQRWGRAAADLVQSGRLAAVPGSPHGLTYSAPDELASIVRAFLAAPGPDERGRARPTAQPG